jgi:DNA repair exonuclease SbcCD ATPase subunit
MNTRLFCFFSLLLLGSFALAQENLPPLPERIPPRTNPALLMRMRSQLAFELQQTQRTLTLIDPNDTQLAATLKAQQAELSNQLKEITQQLQGADPAAPAETVREPDLPVIPKSADPALIQGGIPQTPRPFLPPGMYQEPPIISPMNPVTPPAYQDRDSWETSPWTPKPSKELTEMKQTVESLRKEIAELKESVKALETQIQLLNRNILLSEKANEKGKETEN